MKKILLSISLLTILNSFGQVTNGLTAEYSFNSGNASDDVGTNDGIVYGATLTDDRFGNANQAYLFSGSQYIGLQHSTALKSQAMTVSLWARVDGETANQYHFMYSVVNAYFGSNFCSTGISFNANSDAFFCGSQNASGASYYGTTIATYNSDWQHIVLAYDNSSIKVYVDNVLQIDDVKSFTTVYTTDSVFIGKSGHNSFGTYFTGAIDDIKVFDRVLTTQEVTDLFNSPNPGAAAVSEMTAESMRVYPNPATSSVSVTLGESSEIIILDVNGKALLISPESTEHTLDMTSMEAGVYFIRTAEGQTVKFVKQ